MAVRILEKQRVIGWLLIAISLGIIADPILTTTCSDVGNTCQEYRSFSYYLHAAETVFTSSALFIAAVYDAWKRKKIVSIIFCAFQVAYGLLFLSQLAHQDKFNTPSQYLYQTILILWLAWLCRDLLQPKRYDTSNTESALVRNAVAYWAFLNGIFAIVLSLAHINLFGRIRGLYFTGDSAWLAQHGIIIGVAMLYLSRHLARGEVRARQIFLLICGLEVIKYSSIAPNVGLMVFYMLTFVGLFVLKDNFERGTIPLTWSIRLRDLYFLVSGLLVSALIVLLALDRDNRISVVSGRAADHFSDFVFGDKPIPHAHLASVLLAHTATVFIATSFIAILWVLFRPYKSAGGVRDYSLIEQLLKNHSTSSEDFFKLWPKDKEIFWEPDHSGFVAYKVVGPVAFALADPISKDPAKLLNDFNSWCREHRLKICYLPVYDQRKNIYQSAGLELLQMGSSAVIDINTFINETARDKWWRWRINKTQKSGYTYDIAQPPHTAKIIKQLKPVSKAWLSSGGHVERGFALGYFNEPYLQKCIIHYLKDDQGKVVAFTNQLPLYGQHHTMTIDLLRYQPSSEAMAYLLFKTLESAAADKEYKYFDLGFVPFAKAKGPLLTIAKSFSADKFSSKGLEQFKNKFNPEWQPNYLAYDGDLADLAVIALNIEKVMGS